MSSKSSKIIPSFLVFGRFCHNEQLLHVQSQAVTELSDFQMGFLVQKEVVDRNSAYHKSHSDQSVCCVVDERHDHKKHADNCKKDV